MELQPAKRYVSVITKPKGPAPRLFEDKEILSALKPIKALLTEAKKKKQEQELFDAEPELIDPYEDCVKQVNVLITNLITKFGTNNPAVDILIDASRDLEEVKNSDGEEPEDSEESEED
jgi:hypothetical protein